MGLLTGVVNDKAGANDCWGWVIFPIRGGNAHRPQKKVKTDLTNWWREGA